MLLLLAVSSTSRPRATRQKAAKPLVFALCLLPFAWLIYAAFNDLLGANPAEALIRSTGDWTQNTVRRP